MPAYATKSAVLIAGANASAVPVTLMTAATSNAALAKLTPAQRAYATATGFSGQAGKVALIANSDGKLVRVLFGIGKGEDMMLVGKLPDLLPTGTYQLEDASDPTLADFAFLTGAYRFARYRDRGESVTLKLGEKSDHRLVRRWALGVFLARDLVNTPAGDMGPDALEDAVRALAKKHKSKVTVTKGDALLKKKLNLIHAVGRAAAEAPRLIDMRWGDKKAPKVTLVGKGVCFDSGGLDIKPSAGMLIMKKDMGGAANVLGLASMIMDAGLNVRLRVLIPAVENAISAGAFRPGDIIRSYKGLSVEIGNTDAEGRLVLADALALADEEKPDLMIDMATLTGAARVALGPELPPFYCDDDALAEAVASAGNAIADPTWRMPLWRPYLAMLDSKIADINNTGQGGFAGSITAALFLSRFVEKAKIWAHLDIYAWNPSAKPGRPPGGEAQAIRALYQVLAERYPA